MSNKEIKPDMRYRYEESDIETEIRTSPKKNGKPKKKKNKKKRIILRIAIVFIIVIVVLFGMVAGYVYDKIGKMGHDNFDKNEIEINEGVSKTGYFNILLFGVDARDQEDSYTNSLSDVIMVVSINQDTKKVRIASIYRDTYLQNTKTKTFDKITHAFASGGPSLSMSTINTNLDLDITEYVAINFNVVVDAVDAVGGIDLDITDEEAKYINAYIDEVNDDTGHNSANITKGGRYHVDGVQATAYARIRYTAGGDWKRTERQREVLNLVFEKMKTMSLGNLNRLADKILGQVSTNISTAQILYLASQASGYELEETIGWPYEVADYQPNGVWYGVPRNLEKQVSQLHGYLFDEVDYQVTPTVKEISDKLIKQTKIK